MRPQWRWRLVVAGGVLVMLGCGEPTSPELATGTYSQSDMTEEGCRETPGCWPEPDIDPYKTQPGFRISTVSPQGCFAINTAGQNAAGTGINDIDWDGLDDNCERELAERFRPQFVVSPYDCDLGGAPHWAAKYFPAKAGVVEKPTVRIVYLSAFYRDCGTPETGNAFCDLSLISSKCSGHLGDSEFVVVEVRHHAVTNHWYTSRVFMSAHYRGRGGESSREAVTCVFEPSSCVPHMVRLTYDYVSGNKGTSVEFRQLRWAGKTGGQPVLFLAQGKHGSYPDYSTCNSGGGGGSDSCSGSSLTSLGAPLFFSGNRNIGSVQDPRLDCVTLPGDYFHTGRECFWDEQNENQGGKFLGWFGQWDASAGEEHREFLLRRFECYTYPESFPMYEPVNCERGMVRS